MKPNFAPDLLIESIGSHFNLSLDTRHENGFVLVFENKYKIQIEWMDEQILISSSVGELLPSRFREQAFLDALRANAKSSAFGSLGYSDQKKLLMLVLRYPILPPKEEEFFTLLEGFIQKTKQWTEAVSSGTTRLCI